MNINQYDSYIDVTDWLQQRDQPVAITITEVLEPASGPGSIIFPPTYAFREEDKNRAKAENWLPYSISVLRKDSDARAEGTQVEGNICDLDTVGSQANRMEAVFAVSPLSSLVPQVVIRAKDAKVNLLEIGHRIADGIVRVSDLAAKATEAFGMLAKGRNALALAKLAPTSLVFGFWNSREKDTPKLAIKHPRILTSVIRATNVAPIRRSAQFNAAIDSKALGLPDDLADEALADMGLDSVPAPQTHGGVLVFGEITRKTEINLVALRALAVTADHGVDEVETLKLRRYLLGLCLVAARVQNSFNLRQGCLLVAKPDSSPSAKVVYPSGKREGFTSDFNASYEFALAAAKEFKIWSDTPEVKEFTFQPDKVRAERQAKADKKTKEKAAREARKNPAA
jgi:CRISPR-associated protein Csb1